MIEKLIQEWSGHWDMFILLWLIFFITLGILKWVGVLSDGD